MKVQFNAESKKQITVSLMPEVNKKSPNNTIVRGCWK